MRGVWHSHAEPARKNPYLDLAAGGLLLFGILARVVGFFQNASLIGDEAMLALNIGHRSFTQLLQPLDYAQVATVPFLWAERLAAEVGGVSAYSLRFVPLLAGVGMLYALYRLTDKLLGRVVAVVALALAATAFPLIRYSVEVKPYIVDSLASVLLIWVALRLTENLSDLRGWAALAVGGVIGVLVSTPALLVCIASAGALAIAALRSRRLNLLPWLALLGVLWGCVFAAAYITWYSPVAGSQYMRHYWAPAILQPGTPQFWDRLWGAVSESACTLTCWRGILDLTPGLLLLTFIGTAHIWRQRGPESAALLAGPLAAAFSASALGRYPIATRLVLFAAPLLCIMVAAGVVSVASQVECRWPRIRARWVLFLFLYPSFIVAATLTFVPPADWGVRSVEVRALAEDFRVHGGGEPIYVFARSVPTWVFHTTDWAAPDSSRLTFAARTAGPEGLGFVNASTRGRRIRGEGEHLVYRYRGGIELYGTPTGSQARAMIGHYPRLADPGWAESEAWRIQEAAKPFIWILMSDFTHAGADEHQILMESVKKAGGTAVYRKPAANAVLYRIKFQAGALRSK